MRSTPTLILPALGTVLAASGTVLAAVGMLAGSPAQASPPERIPRQPAGAVPAGARPISLIRGIPDVIQSSAYSCGPGVVQAVLTYYGIWGYQDAYARELGTTPDQGTHPARMAAYFRKWGLDASLREGLETRDLRRFVDRGVPVIVDFQAWGGRVGKDYSQEWEDGHYGIVVGYDRQGFFLEDPSLLGTLGYLRGDELNRRWHDYEIEEGKRRPYRRLGIVVKGRPRPQPAFTRVD